MSTTILVPQAPTFALAALPADVFGSCSIQPPALAPPAPIEDTIYTPVAPGISYESLPEITVGSTDPDQVILVDTSPSRFVGCILDTADNAQGRLNALFPTAIAGDGVNERRNNDIWVYDGAIWNNVGPTPGLTIQNLPSLILPYNETAIYDARVTIGNDVVKFDYALELLTEVPALRVATGIVFAPVTVVPAVTAFIGLDALTPQVSISARVDAPTAETSLTANAPQVNTGSTLEVPVADLELVAEVPELVGRPRTSVFAPRFDVALTAQIPLVATGVSIAVPTGDIALQILKPASIGKLDIEAFDLFLLVEDDLLSLRNP
jgi:hypothetical protein